MHLIPVVDHSISIFDTYGKDEVAFGAGLRMRPQLTTKLQGDSTMATISVLSVENILELDWIEIPVVADEDGSTELGSSAVYDVVVAVAKILPFFAALLTTPRGLAF